MPPPLNPTLKAAILNAIKAGGTCRGIARQHHVSASTVAKIASDNGHGFERAQTKKATEAARADAAHDRASLATASLATARAALRRMNEALPAASAKDAAVAYGIAIDKHLALIKADSDNGAAEARSMLGALADGLQAAADALGAGE